MTKVAHLSQAWLDLQRELTGSLPERAGASGRVQYVVGGRQEGEVRYAVAVVDGRVATASLGDDPDAEVTLSLSRPDAVAIARGELDGNVAFMQGRVKVVGSMGTVMALMPVTGSDEYGAALAELSRQTDY